MYNYQYSSDGEGIVTIVKLDTSDIGFSLDDLLYRLSIKDRLKNRIVTDSSNSTLKKLNGITSIKSSIDFYEPRNIEYFILYENDIPKYIKIGKMV